MRISHYPTDTLTGTEMILASNVDTSTQKYKTVNFTVDTLKSFVTTDVDDGITSIVFEGSSSNAAETTLSVIDPTGDVTIDLPDVSGTIPVLAAVSTTAITATPEEINIIDASAGNTAVVSNVDTSAGAVTSNNYKISHTLTLNAILADNAEHADITITNNKVLATSVVLANTSVNANIDVHTVVAGSFKIRITNKSGGNFIDDSTMVINYRII